VEWSKAQNIIGHHSLFDSQYVVF